MSYYYRYWCTTSYYIIIIRTDEFDDQIVYILITALAVQSSHELVRAHVAQQQAQVGNVSDARQPRVEHFGHRLDEAGRFFHLGLGLSLDRFPVADVTALVRLAGRLLRRAAAGRTRTAADLFPGHV